MRSPTCVRGPRRSTFRNSSMLPEQNRYRWSPIVKRPDYAWPDGKRLAFYVVTNIEYFAFGKGDVHLDNAVANAPATQRNYAWREYGNRVGVWRLLELFDELGLPVSLLLNSEVYDHCPEVVAAFRQRGDEVLGHGRTNSEHQNHFDEAGEATLIRDVTAAITR